MKTRDILILIGLFILAIFIWFRDISWMNSLDDTLPILIALPLFVLLLWPWKFFETEKPLPLLPIAGVVVLFLLGIISNLTVILTMAWVAMLWIWLSRSVESPPLDQIKKLLVLAFMGFPWVTLDAQQLGWYFRLTGAWVTGHFFSLLGANVHREGTSMLINMQPIEVEAACSGLNTLQSMLIAGSIVAFIILGHTWRYWLAIPILFVMAWIANVIRIIALVFASLLVSPQFALGTFHTLGGWVILMVMFVICWGVFTLMEPKTSEKVDS